MNSKALLRLILSVSIFVVTSGYGYADEPGCLGNDFEFTTTFNNKSLKFRYSSECIIRSSDSLTVNRYPIQAYWPGFISHDEALADQGGQYIKSYLGLSYGSTPLMVSSTVEAFRTGRGYRPNGRQGIYEKFMALPSSPEQKTIYIAHPDRDDFHISCHSYMCTIEGITGKVLYRLDLYTHDEMDWLLIHKMVTDFILKSIIMAEF